MQHVNQPAPSLRSVAPDVPVALASVINQSLERDPDRRFQRVSELVEAFAQVSKGVTGELSNMTGSQPSQRLNISKEATGERQTGSWQLLPPIVTSKLGSIPSSSSTQLLGNQFRKSSGLTGSMPRQSVPAPAPTKAPTQMRLPQSAPARVPQEPQIQPMAAAPAPARPEPAKPAPTKSEPAKQESGPNGMQPFDWWSMPGQFQDISSVPKPPKEGSSTRGAAPNVPGEAAPARAAEPARPQGTLRLSDTEAADPWGMDIDPRMSSSSRQAPRSRSRRRSGGMQRRQVIALLAGGGVLAAGVGVAFAFTRQMGMQQQATTATTHTTTTGAPASKSSTTTTTTTNTKTTTATNKQTATTAGHTGTVIAQSSIQLNSAVDFINPTTGRSDILVHLPNGQFAAYDRACTHQQVLINYDPNTHTMICPLHGSIFDPANNGKVLKGPAVTAVAMVPIKINADGTVTTA